MSDEKQRNDTGSVLEESPDDSIKKGKKRYHRRPNQEGSDSKGTKSQISGL